MTTAPDPDAKSGRGTLIEPRTLKGFADVLPEVGRVRKRLLGIIEEVYASYGFDPIQTPAVEYAEILKGKGGQESDNEIFEFTDKGGRHVGLRFDLTVPLARFVAQHQGKLTFPLRAYNIGYVWRGDRPQFGRYREFLQCDADIVGVSGISADIEILSMVQTAMLAMDIGPFKIRMSNRHILDGVLSGLHIDQHSSSVLRALDKVDKIGEDGVAVDLAEIGLGPVEVDSLLDVVRRRDVSNREAFERVAQLAGSTDAGRFGLDRVVETLEVVVATTGRDDLLCFDPSIVRGLDYYTGMVFEVKHETVPQVGSIAAGGRYDDLAGLFTKTPRPGVGGTIGVSRIMSALESMGRLGPAERGRPLVVITQAEDSSQELLAMLAAAVRGTGRFDVEIYPAQSARHSAQSKYADSRHAVYVLTADDAETVSVKEMASGERHGVKVGHLAAFMADRA